MIPMLVMGGVVFVAGVCPPNFDSPGRSHWCVVLPSEEEHSGSVHAPGAASGAESKVLATLDAAQADEVVVASAVSETGDAHTDLDQAYRRSDPSASSCRAQAGLRLPGRGKPGRKRRLQSCRVDIDRSAHLHTGRQTHRSSLQTGWIYHSSAVTRFGRRPSTIGDLPVR